MKNPGFTEKRIPVYWLFITILLTAVITASAVLYFASGSFENPTNGLEKASRSTDRILVLFTNDIHCSIEADEHSLGFAGLARIKDWAKRTSDYVTVADCGDAIQGEAAGMLSEGGCMVDLMNELGYDICTFGNHEFDYGMERILDIAENRSEAQYVSCNFVDLETGAAVVKPYAIIDYDGISVAYVGVSTPETLTSSSPSSFTDENGEYRYGFCQGEDGALFYRTVQSAVDRARQEGADYVIAVAHLGIQESAAPYRSTDLIGHTTGIDAVLDGHSHSVMPGEKVRNKDGEEILLCSTGSRLANVGCLMIDTKGTAGISDDTIDSMLIPDEAAQNMDAAVERILSEYEELLKDVVAHSDVKLSVNSKNGNRMVRCRETAIGDFCADAFRSVSGADLAVVNGGGIRAELPAGDLTYEDILQVFPFGNALCVVEATGQEILDMLEMAYRYVEPEFETADGPAGESGGFLQVSGIKLVIDTGIPSSVALDENGMFASVSGRRRVTDVKILDSETGGYEALDPEKTYTLAANDYMLHEGGDGFGMFSENVFLQDRFMVDAQALITYVEEELGGTVTDLYGDVRERILVKG